MEYLLLVLLVGAVLAAIILVAYNAANASEERWSPGTFGDVKGVHQIGFLNRGRAADLAPMLDEAEEVDAKVVEVTGGGPGKSTRGVNIEISLPDGEVIPSKVAGVSHKNNDGTSRQAYVKRLRPGQMLFLERDEDNPYDGNAVAVFARFG